MIELHERMPPRPEFVYKERLPNGLELIVHEMPWAHSVSARLLVKTGLRYESEHTIGINHYIEHMFLEGSRKYPSRRELDKAITSLGGARRNYAGDEYARYQAKLPVDNANFSTKFIRELVFNPIMAEEAVKREKSIIAAELRRSIDSPSEHRHNLLRKHVWKNYPLGYNTLGTFESIQRITRQDLLDYHSCFYRPNNAILVVAGNITSSQAIDIATQDFGDLPASEDIHPMVTSPVQSAIPRVLIEERDIQQSHILLAFSTKGSGKSSPILPEIQVLSRMIRNNIFHKFVYDLGLSYAAGGYTWLLSDNGNIVVAVEVAPKNTDEAVKRIVHEVSQIKIDEDLIQEAKASVISDLILNMADTDDYAHFIGEQQLYTGTVKSPLQAKNELQAVTATDLYKLKQSLLTNDNVAMVVLGPISKDRSASLDQKLIFE